MNQATRDAQGGNDFEEEAKEALAFFRKGAGAEADWAVRMPQLGPPAVGALSHSFFGGGFPY